VRRWLTSIEERLLVPTYSSPWPVPPIVAHRSMALPFQLRGEARRRKVTFAGHSLDVVEIGREKLLRPLCARLFGELPQPVAELPQTLWNPDALARSGTDMVLAEVHRWRAPRFRRAGWLIVPHSVRWQGEMSGIPPRDCSHGLRDNFRKIRKQGFSIVQATESADWEEFYASMVGPQALVRHGPSAWIPSPTLMKEFARIGVLHLILRGGERVAGICTIPRGGTLWLAISGVRHGDPALLRQGAGFAILALTIEWAREQGYRAIDAGRTGPFLNDGLQQFKRKWGLAPVLDPLAHVAAIWPGSLLARQAFAREPVLVEQEATLQAYAGE
jgi:Acetyltransferase (GNAT) domain